MEEKKYSFVSQKKILGKPYTKTYFPKRYLSELMDSEQENVNGGDKMDFDTIATTFRIIIINGVLFKVFRN